MDCFQKLFSSTDLFGQSISLNMNKQPSFTTAFGGFASLSIVCVVILFFQSNILSFFRQEKLTTTSEQIYLSNPDIIELNADNYMFAVTIEQKDFITRPFFNVSVQQMTQERLANGTIIKSNHFINLQPCTKAHFDILARHDHDISFQFDQLSLQTWLCPELTFKIQLGGIFYSDIFNYAQVVVSECNNNISPNQVLTWRPQCATPEEKAKYFESKGHFKLQIQQSSATLNPTIPKDYLQYYLDGEVYFTFVPKKQFIQGNVYYKKYQISNDRSSSPITYKFVQFRDLESQELYLQNYEDYRDLSELGRETDVNYVSIYLRRSPFTNKITRKFEKIGDLLSNLGGFLQITLVGFGFFVAFYNKTSSINNTIIVMVQLSNKIFDFNDSQDFKVEQQNSLLQQDNQPQKESNKRFNIQEFNSALNRLLARSKPVRVTFKLILSQLGFKRFFNDPNTKLLNAAIENIHTELDIYFILYKIQEIDKLKSLLLTQNQLVLFNFSPKPLIKLQNDVAQLNRLEYDEIQNVHGKTQMEVEATKVVSEAYEKVLVEQYVEFRQQVISNKLVLDLIGNQLQSQEIGRKNSSLNSIEMQQSMNNGLIQLQTLN